MTYVGDAAYAAGMGEQTGLDPGWYPHQEFPGALRYWDGRVWTDQLAPAAAQPPDAVPEWIGVVGWLTAIFLPPVGLACGAYLVTKDAKGEGFGMMALALVAAVAWVFLIPASA